MNVFKVSGFVQNSILSRKFFNIFSNMSRLMPDDRFTIAITKSSVVLDFWRNKDLANVSLKKEVIDLNPVSIPDSFSNQICRPRAMARIS